MRVELVAAALVAALFALPCAPALAQPEARAVRVRNLDIDERRPKSPEAGAGVVVLSARSAVLNQWGGGAVFHRLDAPRENETLAPLSNDHFNIGTKSGRGRNDSRLRVYRAYQAPPGRYVFSTYAAVLAGGQYPGAQYCFGTIGFDLVAGDVLYVGDFVGSGGGVAIDFDLDDARRALAPAPALQSALKAARFVEPVEFECNWADMARFALTERERRLLVEAQALPPPEPAQFGPAEPAEAAPAAPGAHP